MRRVVVSICVFLVLERFLRSLEFCLAAYRRVAETYAQSTPMKPMAVAPRSTNDVPPAKFNQKIKAVMVLPEISQ